MKLTHNFRNYSRKVLGNFKTITRPVLVFTVFMLFLFSLFFRPANLNFIKSDLVKGAVNIQEERVDVGNFLKLAAEDIALDRVTQARQKLEIVLEFDPDNIYANNMNNNLSRSLVEVERDIARTLEILKLQPNWKEAWVKLADLYEKAGNPKLATEARERARSLKTSWR